MLRGWLVRPLARPDGCRALCAAIIRQALLDAGRGSLEAADWLDTVGAEWCEHFLGLDGRAWRAADVRAAVGGGDEAARCRAYRERVRDDPNRVARDRARWAATNEKRKQERAARAAGLGT